MATTAVNQGAAARPLKVSRAEAAASAGSDATGILLVLLCAAVVRFGYHWMMYPSWTFDFWGYVRAAYLLSHGYFTDGARTPGFLLFLTLARWLDRVPFFDTGAAIIASGLQSALGVAATALIYYALLALKVRRGMALAGAAFFGASVGVCVFEMLLLPQSLSLFAMTASVALFALTMAAVEKRKRNTALAIATGLMFSAAVLIRPENLVFCIILALVPATLGVVCRWRGDFDSFRQFGKIALLLPLAAAPAILCWMTWNYIGIGRFRVTTLTSWNMSSAVYNLFDRVGPEDRVLGEWLARADLIRNHPEKVPPSERFIEPTAPGQVVQDTYWATLGVILRHHRDMPLTPLPPSGRFGTWIRSFGSADARQYTHSMAAGALVPEVAGLDPNDVGDYIGRVSWKLVRNYPGAWLQNGYRNFAREAFRFHMGPPPVEVELEPRSFENNGSPIHHAALRPVVIWADRLEAPVLAFLFVLTLALGALFPLAIFRRQVGRFAHDTTAAGIAFGVIATFVACCLLACYMPHYGVPHWGAIVICGTYGVDRARRAVGDAAKLAQRS